LRALVASIARQLSLPDKYLSIFLCDDATICKLNHQYFKRDIETDVIAFPLEDDKYFGEVIISVERAVKVCEKYGNNWEDEFTIYLIHGILHILGYDDMTPAKKRVMFKKQNEIFKKI